MERYSYIKLSTGTKLTLDRTVVDRRFCSLSIDMLALELFAWKEAPLFQCSTFPFEGQALLPTLMWKFRRME